MFKTANMGKTANMTATDISGFKVDASEISQDGPRKGRYNKAPSSFTNNEQNIQHLGEVDLGEAGNTFD